MVDARCLMRVVCCVLRVGCKLLCGVWWLLFVARCLSLRVVRCALCWCLALVGACCSVVAVRWSWFVVRCSLLNVCCLLFVCCLFVVCLLFVCCVVCV